MDPLGVAVIVAVLVVALTIGLWRRRTDGMLRDPAVAAKRRCQLLAAAGLEVPERPRVNPSAAATAAAVAASTAVTAVPGQKPSLHIVRDQTEIPDMSGEREREAERTTPAQRESGRAERDPERPMSELRNPERPEPDAREPDARAVTPDVREEPGVVEPDGNAAGEQLGQALLDRLGVGPAQATLLQFSSAFCAPCRAVRRVSSDVADLLPGVQHVEVDAESHLDEVRALGIWRTPTLLLLDADGRVFKRATGVPSKPQLIAALAEILPAAD
jgi:thiol-disulfide isomerase/thioredoxin